jgi:hypothetical protein
VRQLRLVAHGKDRSMPKPADKNLAIEVSAPTRTDVATKVDLTRRVEISPTAGNGHPGVPTVDVRVGEQAIGEIVAARELSFARVYAQLDSLKNDLVEFFTQVPETLPLEVRGQLLNPDGSPAASVSVEAPKPAAADGNGAQPYPWPGARTITDARGAFALPLPTVPIPEAGLELVVKGSDGQTSIAARPVDLAAGGALGVVPLDRPLAPLPQNVVAALTRDVSPTSADDVSENPQDFADKIEPFTLGEGDCARSFRSNAGVIDRFSYSLLVRLVAPEVAPKTLISVRRQDGRLYPMPLLEPHRTVEGALDPAIIIDYFKNFGSWQFVDRTPISAPIDVSGFLAAAGNDPAGVPKAASLGLGYVLKMHQTWIPVGLSLGDLVYSLPLAPGEQQRVAVFEQRQTQSVVETETLSVDELQSFSEVEDSSTLATFNSAYREAASGGSSMSSESSAGSVGGGASFSFFGLFSAGGGGGYSSNSASSQASSWQQGSKDYASAAAQSFHSALGRHAAASRRSARTGMRLATATDTEEVTTRVVTNHNHGHALTMQWWEVLRHFAVASTIDDVQLVCFVPFDLVDFLPSGQPRTLPATGYDYSRDNLLARYAVMLRHLDVLTFELRFRPDFQYGLRLLRDFAGNPTMDVQDPSSGTAEDEVDFSVTGTFLPFEDVSVTLVAKSGLRVGPVRLQPPGGISELTPGQFETGDELLDALRKRRNDTGEGVTLTAKFSLPEFLSRSDIARFEIARSFRPLAYRLKEPSLSLTTLIDVLEARQAGSVSYQAGTLESELGGPLIWDVTAKIDPSGPNLANADAGPQNAERMGGSLPIAALRVGPVLSFANLLRIEGVFQHVVSNTTRYSRAVWMSLLPEERAIMLERYTIGVPNGGFGDPTQEVPLLNCVANEVLGYFGNSAVMPFFIPEQVAGELRITTRQIQEAIYKFHKQAFLPPRSSITLPSHGTLGEAVLGDCDSCEKIDLTRFWNWQDSPADVAAEPSAADFKGDTLAGVTGPSALTTQPVNQNLLTIGGPAPTAPDLASQLVSKAPQLTPFGDLTGLSQLQKAIDVSTQASSAGLKESMATGQEMADTLVKTTADVIKAALGGGGDGKSGQKASGDQAKQTQDKKSGVDKLKSNLDSYIKVAGNQSDQGAADTWAQGLIGDIFGDSGIGVSDAASFFDALAPAAGDDAVATMGKTALLAALGL